MPAARPGTETIATHRMLWRWLAFLFLRGLYDRKLHADKLLSPAYWGMNAGLAMMVFLSLLPARVRHAAIPQAALAVR